MSTLPLPTLDLPARPSVADHVFDHLYRQIMSLDLPPDAKLSEAEVARQMGVSRQPVRDAFYRLSKLGFLVIRPQRATTVSLISPRAVLQARFIRTAIEVETVRTAATALKDSDIDVLEALIERQQAAIAAGDKTLFHDLDDRFHKEIADRAGLGFAWEVIRENKAHMDRVRMFSLTFASQQAHDDHLVIVAALKAGDPERATAAMREHLGRILGILAELQTSNHAWMAEEEG